MLIFIKGWFDLKMMSFQSLLVTLGYPFNTICKLKNNGSEVILTKITTNFWPKWVKTSLWVDLSKGKWILWKLPSLADRIHVLTKNIWQFYIDEICGFDVINHAVHHSLNPLKNYISRAIQWLTITFDFNFCNKTWIARSFTVTY